ncbi:uncharacterized protein LOC121652924 isoform X2 [Melanotaenia boesemani]|uniref:uncharacterized protein LOC121652924 isoform X2 n=1 Tax=Melanotaenia boesemani TaxID=1250792 RepID=UPI001C04D850|nr:uncharacterized protein LOC121652924 isoform X2 [Melanotaenia boesemani]
MSSVQHLREFISARLTAAAEEIFTEFEKTIVQYEEEIDRQRRLLDVTWKPHIHLNPIELPQHFTHEEEVALTHQELCNQDRSSTVDQEEPEPPQIKEEQEEICTSPEEEQLVLKEETESFMIAVTHENREQSKPETSSEQLLFQISALDETPECEGSNHEDSESAADGESEPENQRHRDRSDESHSSNVENSGTSGSLCAPGMAKKSVSCDFCGKVFTQKYNMMRHRRTHTDLDEAEEKERRKHEKKEMRHKEVTTEELNNLEADKDEVNTNKSSKWAVKTLRDFLAQKNMDISFESYAASTLNDVLRLFYASVQSTKGGGEYSVASLRSLRAGINHHLRDVNIISDTAFKSSNAVFKAILKRYRKSGKDTSFHHPRIPESDLEIIRCSPALSPETPLGLVRKVWFDIQLCLARRGREGNRELTMTSFNIQRDEAGVEYVSLAQNPDAKNHKDPNNPHKQSLRGFMLARPGDPLCPVQSFKKYISKCPPDAKSFYLHPKRSITTASDVWYSREPMGVHYLGDMLKRISEEVGLSRIYTNHSLRRTAVGRLSDAGLETRQIRSVTGRRCESSLQAYRAPSVQEKQEWSNILSSCNVPTSSGQGP